MTGQHHAPAALYPRGKEHRYLLDRRQSKIIIIIIIIIIILFTGAYSPGWTFGLPFQGFLITHIQTYGRTPLDE
jgi:hypothetical protein